MSADPRFRARRRRDTGRRLTRTHDAGARVAGAAAHVRRIRARRGEMDAAPEREVLREGRRSV